MSKSDEHASALAELGDWPERWIALAEGQQAKPFTPRLAAFREQTLYLAKHCEKQGMDASPLIAFARELQRTCLALRPDFPDAHVGIWVLLERLRLRLEPFESEGESETPILKAEANVLVGDYLKQYPNATARQVAEAIGIALGRVSGLSAWQAVLSERNQQQPKGKAERQLTDKMLQAVSKGDDPAAIAEAREIAWHHLIDSAPPEQRAELHAMSKQQKTQMIDLFLAQKHDDRQDADG